ncbi:deoxyribodipyrimidine photo-lyase [Metallosphaera tengchongensis]|uniref:Deoxyribodipyrimidine photo-lyase n=1 Tax=Metallosphaera tengchongensis TaxID=1532350 RepID=A0A6N0NZ07_9CREN|nr:deoxyribodipyrimidine photo-lyase [Metallosphaera tengchongensis]QKR01053.1 deoxyribodipyrimidine photo-lyase [Metallosphaera tengchongensis]
MRCGFIFRRDLRLEDNTCLSRALDECEEVIPLFILDPRQVENNPYKSPFALGFMLDTLLELNERLEQMGSKLHVIKGVAEEVVKDLSLDKIYVNEDYTPFSVMRDAKIAKVKRLVSCEDLLLTPKEFFVRKGKPYSVFTHFYNDARKLQVREPISFTKNFGTMPLPGVELLDEVKDVKRGTLAGGRKEGLRQLERAKKVDYSLRNFPASPGTTRLSPYLKFGVLSVREVYHGVSNEEIRRQLYWRDFYTLIAHYNPHVFGNSYKREFNCIKWENNEEKFKLWSEGRTGYPIVDAGMRELNSTGFMHNRTRMITASFLVKVLHIDWRWGERYFATRLVDFDPSVNNGNWQWVASTGTDYMFRNFNPWIQQRKFDPEAEYIRTWVPELEKEPTMVIHEIYKYKVPGYPSPIVDYAEEVRRARLLYEESLALCQGKSIETYISRESGQ